MAVITLPTIKATVADRKEGLSGWGRLFLASEYLTYKPRWQLAYSANVYRNDGPGFFANDTF